MSESLALDGYILELRDATMARPFIGSPRPPTLDFTLRLHVEAHDQQAVMSALLALVGQRARIEVTAAAAPPDAPTGAGDG